MIQTNDLSVYKREDPIGSLRTMDYANLMLDPIKMPNSYLSRYIIYLFMSKSTPDYVWKKGK